MSKEWILTIFVSEGQSRKLGQRSEAIEAVRQGLLLPETRVIARLASGEKIQSKAINLDHLADLFPDHSSGEDSLDIPPSNDVIIEPSVDPEVATAKPTHSETELETEREAISNINPAPVEASPSFELEPTKLDSLDTENDAEIEIEEATETAVELAEPTVDADVPSVHDQIAVTSKAIEEPSEDLPEITTDDTREPVLDPVVEKLSQQRQVTQAATASDLPADDAWSYQNSDTRKTGGFGVKGAILAAILAIFAVGAIMWYNGGDTGGQRYLLSDTNGFEQPKLTAKSGDRLTYGQAVVTEPSEVDGWLRIVEGPYKGLFLPATLLIREVPPKINKSLAGVIVAKNDIALHTAADETTEVIGSIAAGDRRFAQGGVQGADGRTWYLFLIEIDGLPRPAFGLLSGSTDLNQPLTSQDETIAPEVSATEALDTEPSVVAGPVDSCASIGRKLERFTCQDPTLRENEAEFNAAYARAAASFAQTGQPLQAKARYAARIEQCNTPKCVRTRYREQTALLDSLKPVSQVAPTPVQRDATRAATPRGNPDSWIRSDDYPARAMKVGEEGTVRFNLTIFSNGAVSSCQVVGTSGSAALDEATCKLVSRRARFNPALDASGTAVEGRYSNAVRWRLPGKN